MAQFRPKYITFDCYGTLTNFQMAEAAHDLYGEQLKTEQMQQFIKNFAAYRLDEILGDWKPYNEVVHNAVERTCKRTMSPSKRKTRARSTSVFQPGARIQTFQPVSKVAKEIPLVILSNAMNEQIYNNVEKLGRHSTPSTQPNRRRLTSLVSRRSNTCSISLMRTRKTFCMSRHRSATT